MATILIADDDSIIRESACQMLRSTEHVVVPAENGLEALRLMDVLSVDVLVTDMLTLNIDGIEVISFARQHYPELKVLAISGGGSVRACYVLHMAKMLGAHGTLEKPLRVDTFLNAIEELLRETSEGRISNLPRPRVKLNMDGSFQTPHPERG